MALYGRFPSHTRPRLNRRLLGAFIWFLLLPVITNAEEPGTVSAITTFGLVGVWAVDCGRKASSANEYLVVSVDSYGVIELRHDLGSYDDVVYRVIEATRRGRSQISLRQALAPDGKIILKDILVKSGSSIRLWSSQGADGRVLVQDGEMTSSKHGRETNWMERCDRHVIGAVSSVNFGTCVRTGSDARRHRC
jgi:hypothetical protein